MRPARILFVIPPGFGHFFPIVPLAWALRGAGHDVLVATCGESVHAATRAGLPVVTVASQMDVAAVQRRHKDRFVDAFPPVEPHDGVAGTPVFPEICDLTADNVVDTARRWRADLLMFTPEATAALVAAAVLSIPAVFFSAGLTHTPAMMRERYALVYRTLERFRLAQLAQPDAWIDVSPPSVRPAGSDGWPMRHVPYHGGGAWTADTRSDRPRVAVTLGTVVPLVFGLTPIRALVDAAAGVDATFVIAHGSTNTRDLGPLPANVIATSWIALDQLLASACAAIHHGGFGTTMATFCARLPQMLLPLGADHFCNAERVRQSGAGVRVNADDLTADVLEEFLRNEPLREGAERIGCEIARMPPPADLVPKLVALVG